MFNQRILAVLVAGLILLSGCSQPQQLNEKQKQQIKLEIETVFNGLVDAAKALDTQAYFAFFDQHKFVGLNEDGSNWNNFAELAQLITPGFAAVKQINSLTFPNVTISVIDAHTAILVNQFKQNLTLHDGTVIEVAGGGTQVWSNHSGQWKLVSVSASSAAE